jgi:hypothetical protein
MRTRIVLAAYGAALVAAVQAPAAAAAVTCVAPPSVTTCPNHSIAVAVTVAGPGGTILVAPGTYYENDLYIPPGYDGLTVSGSGKTATIIDIGNNTALGITGSTLRGFSIAARKVTVRNMTIRNGITGLESFAPGTIVTGTGFRSQDGTAVSLHDYGAQVAACEFRDAQIGIDSVGFGTIVKGNAMTNTLVGVLVEGDQSQVLFNRFVNGAVAIEAPADGVQIKSNDVRYQTFGIVVGSAASGTLATIQSNTILGTTTGIQVQCINCAGGLVAQNVVTDATAYGIVLYTDQPGLAVQGNSVLRAGHRGIVVANIPGVGDRGVYLTGNKVADVGNAVGSACYRLSGDGNVASKNQALRCGGAGFWAIGNENTLDGNIAVDGFENGIKVDGNTVPYTYSYLTGNRTTGNTGAGIAVVGNAANTVVQFNTSAGNRANVCDDALNGTTFTSNNFEPPSAAIACDIAH